MTNTSVALPGIAGNFYSDSPDAICISDLLLGIASTHRSGILTIVRYADYPVDLRVAALDHIDACQFLFLDGKLIYSRIQSAVLPVETYALREGMISEADLERARNLKAAGEPKPLSEILVDSGALELASYFRCVELQNYEAILAMLRWEEAAFTFVPHDPAQRLELVGGISIQVTVPALVLEGARRHAAAGIEAPATGYRRRPAQPHSGGGSILPNERVIYRKGDRYLRVSQLLGGLLSGDESRVLNLVNGVRTIVQIAHEAGLAGITTARLLYTLERAGLLARIGSGEISTGGPVIFAAPTQQTEPHGDPSVWPDKRSKQLRDLFPEPYAQAAPAKPAVPQSGWWTRLVRRS